MSNSSQLRIVASPSASESPPPLPVARTLALQLPPQFRIDNHTHSWSQLIYADQGALLVEAQTNRWIVPPHRGLWMPADVHHSIEMLGEVSMRTLYLRPDSVGTLVPAIRVLDVSALLRELILEVVRLGILCDENALHQNLLAVLVAQIADASALALDLPLPSDPRARRVAEKVRDQSAQNATLAVLAQDTGASPRTIERLFLVETGLSFGRWRQQARLQRAVCSLAEGRDVASVAFEAGYESVSAFVAMFKQSLGTTPGRYFHRKTTSQATAK